MDRHSNNRSVPFLLLSAAARQKTLEDLCMGLPFSCSAVLPTFPRWSSRHDSCAVLHRAGLPLPDASRFGRSLIRSLHVHADMRRIREALLAGRMKKLTSLGSRDMVPRLTMREALRRVAEHENVTLTPMHHPLSRFAGLPHRACPVTPHFLFSLFLPSSAGSLPSFPASSLDG